MSYSVKEIIYTLQGEGARSGRAAVFCRFANCNLWSGHEADRATATCRFCDTDFVGTDGPNGGEFASADELAEAVARQWRAVEIENFAKHLPQSADSIAFPPRSQLRVPSPSMGKGQGGGGMSPDARPPTPTLPHGGGGRSDGNPQGTIPANAGRLVVCTGGEPLLQMDAPLIDA